MDREKARYMCYGERWPIPEGTYEFTVKDFKRVKLKGNKNYSECGGLCITLSVISHDSNQGEYKTYNAHYLLTFGDKKGFDKMFAAALGIDINKIKQDNSSIIGLHGKAYFKKSDYRRKYNENIISYRVSFLYIK